MAKDRKLTVSRSERFLGSYGYGGGDNHDTVDHGDELGEEDVWSMVDNMVNGDGDHLSITSDWSSRAAVHERTTRSHHRPKVPHGIGLLVAFDDQSGKMVAPPRIIHQSPRGRHAASAPMNVADWSNIYRVDSAESMHDSDDGIDDQYLDMVPPHEYLARSHKLAAKSVFEGVGRTLKGRDMSRVRDAVWNQTGFDG